MWQSHRLQKTQLRRLLSPYQSCFGSEISTTKRYRLNREKGKEKKEVDIYSVYTSGGTKTLCHKTSVLIHLPLKWQIIHSPFCVPFHSQCGVLSLSIWKKPPKGLCYETHKQFQALQFVFITVLVNIRTTGKCFHVTWKQNTRSRSWNSKSYFLKPSDNIIFFPVPCTVMKRWLTLQARTTQAWELAFSFIIIVTFSNSVLGLL